MKNLSGTLDGFLAFAILQLNAGADMNYFVFFILVAVNGAPTKDKVIYDQKQAGGTNVQVHLKDLQIIALLGDDLLGDYDYNYDYSDFTVKPTTNVTLKPPPPPEEISSTTSTISSSLGPVKLNATSGNNTSSLDRIVQIIQDPAPSVGIVPSEEMGSAQHAPAAGEALQLRRCASGFSRDKRGRCRRVRKPTTGHSGLDIGRLASSLAARIRGRTGEDLIN